MIELKHDDTVRAEAWAETITVRVGTIEGCAKEWGKDPDEMIANAIERHHQLAWTLLPPAGLYGDRAYAAKKMAEREADAARSVTLQAGMEVSIAGRHYTVKFPQNQDKKEYPSLADPIHFVPVKA